MNAERILIAAECIGDAKWFIERASVYAGERSIFWPAHWQKSGHSVSDCQGHSQMRAAELMLHEAIRLFETGENPARRQICQNCFAPTRPGPQLKCVFRRLAVLALPRNM